MQSYNARLISNQVDMKEKEDWAALGDYYLALRYVAGMVETDFSDAMNLDIGSQMMLAFASLGNRKRGCIILKMVQITQKCSAP